MRGAKCRLSRAVGVVLPNKSGLVSHERKCRANSRPGKAPGHRLRRSEFGEQLNMKQVLRFYYEVSEKQFSNYFKLADKQKGSTADNLLNLLESRLDNIIYRMGFAATHSEARQMVSHKHILVNGQVVNIPSYHVKRGDEIEVRESARKQARIIAAMELAKQRPESNWLDVNYDQAKGRFVEFPEIDQLPPEFKQVHLVVELYSK